MTYAQVKNGVCVNIIDLEDNSLLSIFSVGFDYCIRVDNISPQPGIGWGYDGTTWTAP